MAAWLPDGNSGSPVLSHAGNPVGNSSVGQIFLFVGANGPRLGASNLRGRKEEVLDESEQSTQLFR